jgi:uncharacterized protein (DUF1778 family)
MAKPERLDLRLTVEQKRLIEDAAHLEGTTAAGFTVAAVMERAAEAVQRQRALVLSPEAWDEFVAALDAEPTMPPALRELLDKPSVLES